MIAGPVYRTKADLLTGLASISEDSAVTVLTDETKAGKQSTYIKRYKGIEYVSSIATSDESEVATGVFFDTAAGDKFTDLIIPSDPSLTVTDSSIAFSSSAAVILDALVRGLDGNALKSCFDHLEVNARFTVNSFPAAAAEGAAAVMLNEILGVYGGRVAASGSGPGYILPALLGTNNQWRVNGTNHAFTGPCSVRMRYRREGDQAKAIFSYDGGPETTLSYTMVFTPGSFELPRMFSGLGVRFRRGDMILEELKVFADFPNAPRCFLGNSLTQGRTATAYADGFAARIRANRSDPTLIAGAPSAKTGDWTTRLESVIRMRPKRCIVELGPNDILNGVSLGTFQTNYTTIMNTLIANDIVPIALSIPPLGNANVPAWNAWLASQGWRYVDIYTPLLGTGYSLNPAHDSGDGIHWNGSGHEVVGDVVGDYEAAL